MFTSIKQLVWQDLTWYKCNRYSVNDVWWSFTSFLGTIACENIRFSSLFVAEDVSRETPSATKSEEKLMFSQAKVAKVCSKLNKGFE